MTDVAIKCFAPGDSKKNSSQNHKACVAVIEHKTNRMNRIQRMQHKGIMQNSFKTHKPQCEIPKKNHRPKNVTDFSGPLFLDEKKNEQYKNRDGKNERFKNRRSHPKTFNGT